MYLGMCVCVQMLQSKIRCIVVLPHAFPLTYLTTRVNVRLQGVGVVL